MQMGQLMLKPGVNTGALYLNNPKQQLMDIIHVLFSQSGKMSDMAPTGDNIDGKITHGGAMDRSTSYGNLSRNGVFHSKWQ